MIYAIIFLILGVSAYSISQLQQHAKLIGRDDTKHKGFWGINSWTRKYKGYGTEPKFPGSTTFLVFLTDGYHLCQALAMVFLSLSFGFLIGDWRYGAGAWAVIHTVHYFTYKLLSK